MSTPTYKLAHSLRVQRLYRQALKLTHHWAVDRVVLSNAAIKLRAEFEAHRNEPNVKVAEQLVEAGEALLKAKEHPDPYRYPYMPGGTLYERNVPVPKELLTNPYAHH